LSTVPGSREDRLAQLQDGFDSGAPLPHLRALFSETPGHAAQAPGEAGGEAERSVLEEHLGSRQGTWVRKEMEKAIRKLNRHGARCRKNK